MKIGTLEQWQKLGDMTKEVHEKLIALCIAADQIMPGKDWCQLGKAQTGLQEFRSHAENVMFKQLGGPAGGASISIFYGGTEGSYLPK